jgi:putative NADPH-quinone reductase
MRVMVTIDHPWEWSFNYVILSRVVAVLDERGCEVDVLNLHQENFDPVMHVQELAGYMQGKSLDPKVADYQRRIMQADHLVYIFPVWWEVMPALLKGFFDKVFLPQWAFRRSASPVGACPAGTSVTMGAPRPIYTSVEPVLQRDTRVLWCLHRWFNICEWD